MSESSANVDEEARGMTVTHDDGKQPQPKQSAAAAVTYVNDTDVLVMSASVEEAKTAFCHLYKNYVRTEKPTWST